MTDLDLETAGVADVQAAMTDGGTTSADLVAGYLARIDARDRRGPAVHAIRCLARDATDQAGARDAERRAGQARGPLHGVPVAVKDLLDIKGLPTGAGSLILRSTIAETDATVVRRLRSAGAVIIGKVHTTEAALLDYHPSLPQPRNPWSAEHWAGASSSGSGVATAAGLCYGAIGTDTGGSIRTPSAANGITGLKPTWGRVSRYGLFPMADSLDHIGPMARSAQDVAAMLQAIAGADSQDPTALLAPRDDYLGKIAKPIDGVVIGIDDAFALDGLDAEIARPVRDFCEVMIDLGAQIKSVKVPWDDEINDAGLAIMLAELAHTHADLFSAHASQYGPKAAVTIEIGRNIEVGSYIAATQRRAAFVGEMDRMFQDVDLLITPGLGIPVPSLADLEALASDVDAVRHTLYRFASPFNLSGLPTLSFPGGSDANRMPIGLQLVGGRLTEALLCRAGYAFQQVTSHHVRRPEIA